MVEPSPAGQHTLRRHNSALVLRAVAGEPGVSRAAIAAGTGLAKATVSSLVDRLIAADLVAETGPVARTGRGRPSTGLTLSTTGPHGLGVEIGVDYLATCLVDLTGRLHAHRMRPGDNRARSAPQVLSRVIRVLRAALREAETLGVPVGGIGVAVPGLVEASTGRLRLAPNLGWRDVDLGSHLSTALADRLPPTGVVVGNEADFAAEAELWQSGPAGPGGQRDFVHVSGEIGIGAGFVVGGVPFPGVRGFSGEIGHIPVDPNGPVCGCGARGCLDRLAGLEWIMRDAGVWDGRPGVARPPAEVLDVLVERLTEGDTRSRWAVRAAGRWLGIALAAAINVLDIPTVVLGGSYAALEPWLRDPLCAELDTRVLSSACGPVTVVRSALGREAAVRGAAASVVRAIIADPDAFVVAGADPAG
ncbi:MAG TPA: ROK family transcriptional regulator [Pseudonocardiaceae bacterium]|jgi:predicted NBD/HSP70 family sugar kinase|nr:ROK family transcriptional regulator [Pseudonocardiaceae bacterium]